MPKRTGQSRRRSRGQYRSRNLDAFLDGATKGCLQGCSRGCLITFPFVLISSLYVCFISILTCTSIKNLIIGLIQNYQINLSQKIDGKCLFAPSCSNYAVQAIEKYGLLKGVSKGFFRILRCNSYIIGLNSQRVVDIP